MIILSKKFSTEYQTVRFSVQLPKWEIWPMGDVIMSQAMEVQEPVTVTGKQWQETEQRTGGAPAVDQIFVTQLIAGAQEEGRASSNLRINSAPGCSSALALADAQIALSTRATFCVLACLRASFGGPYRVDGRCALVSFGGYTGLHTVEALLGATKGCHEAACQAGPTISGVPELFSVGCRVASVRVVLEVALCGHGGVVGGFGVIALRICCFAG